MFIIPGINHGFKKITSVLEKKKIERGAEKRAEIDSKKELFPTDVRKSENIQEIDLEKIKQLEKIGLPEIINLERLISNEQYAQQIFQMLISNENKKLAEEMRKIVLDITDKK